MKKSVSNSKLTKEVFQVLFYGTQETACLPLKELAVISPDHVKKFSSPAALKRKHFKEGLEEMKAEFDWIPSSSPEHLSSSPHAPVKKVNQALSDMNTIGSY